MILKYVLLITLACFIAEGENAAIENYSIFDSVFKLIEKLRNTVNNAIKSVISKINDLKNGIIHLAEDVINGFKKKIDDFIQGIFDEFQKLKNKAEAIGVDVSDCIDENENKIKQIASQIFLDTTSCITTKTMKAFEILDVAVRNIKAIINDVNKLQEDFDKCENVKCYVKMGVKASELLISLPIRATNVFLKAQETIIVIQLEITACVGEKFLLLQNSIAPVIMSVNECIAGKISGVTKTSIPPKPTSDVPTYNKILIKNVIN